jgi:hypothetical protein
MNWYEVKIKTLMYETKQKDLNGDTGTMKEIQHGR